MQVTNLYPPPEILAARRIEDIDLRNDLPRNEALVEANAARVVRYLNGDPSFTHELLVAIFAEVQMKSGTPHFGCSCKRLSPVPRSFLTVKIGDDRFVFLSRKSRLYPKKGAPIAYPYKRINRFLAVKLGRDGAIQEINEAVKVFFQFQPDGEGVELEAANLAMRELSIIQQLQSEYTPRTYAVVKYLGNHAPTLARFEQYIGRNLQQVYETTNLFYSIPAPFRYKMARDITKAVQFIHQKDIVHRDLKLENFLVQENGNTVRVFISDFGLSRHVNDTQSRQLKYGTLMWSAPEIAEITANPSAVTDVDQRAELWSLGLVLYVLSGLTHWSLTRLSEVNKINTEIENIQRQLEYVKKAKASQKDTGNEPQLMEFDSQIMRLEFRMNHCLHTKQERLDLWRSNIREIRPANASTVPKLKAIAEKLLTVEPEKRASLEAVLALLEHLPS